MEKALVVALDLGNDAEFLYDLEELVRLCEACDMEVTDTVIQRSGSMNKALFILFVFILSSYNNFFSFFLCLIKTKSVV